MIGDVYVSNTAQPGCNTIDVCILVYLERYYLLCLCECGDVI